VINRGGEGRVFLSTYPTMMNLIDAEDGHGVKRFGVGHFDLVIIDEAHRSVYQKYGAIFSYFDSLLTGLTATPRDEIDRNTYELFDLDVGLPTDEYGLDQAIADGFLVPYRAISVALKFPREGIRYADLSEEEKARWDLLDWEESVLNNGFVDSGAINSWLFNTDTIDKALEVLMTQGCRDATGDQLGKTILFARNHKHAQFIQDRFDHHYPHLAGKAARVIDNQSPYAQSLIDEFANPNSELVIAISVDMLDTGIDIPEIVNLMILKPVRSGQQIYARGRDLVVLAMVNTGAEIIADGHIHVYAPMRGKAMAGARGNTEARIFALSLEAELISIAGIYRTSENPLPAQVQGKPTQVRLEGEKLVMLALT
jgi:type I restriction enzyme R subunit